jgi:putative salt-induced outer membrane protein
MFSPLKGPDMPPTRLLATACLAAAPLLSFAQVTVKNDGQWRALFTAGASVSSGNSDSTTVNLSGEAVKASTTDKLSLNGRAMYLKDDDSDSEQRYAFGAHYQRDLTDRIFGFGQFDALKDEPANLSSRLSVGGGAGYHLIKRDDLTWDVSGGLGYTHERYVAPAIVDGVTRSRYGNLEVLLAEESNHKVSDNTTLKQRLAYLPDLRNSGEYRATFDGGLSVAMTKRLSLTATVQHRYDSNPGEGLKKNDTLFITGVSFRID